MKKTWWLACLLVCISLGLSSQNETSKWYFGNAAAVDFISGSPVTLTNSVMYTGEGSASIAGPAGNLLFYTNGSVVWNANHVAMPNGMGLFGSSISCQSAVIVRRPGSATIYYVFTMRNWTDSGNGAHYSIVDMSLAGGLGDVTTKNHLLYGNTRESLTAVCHANGVDAWIVIHDMYTSEFRSYLLTASGISALPVVSTVGAVFTGGNRYGSLKASPDGNKLGYALGGSAGVTTELYDFNRSTGVVSNAITLNNGTFSAAYGIEFSPNNQVLYVCEFNGSTIQQYNLAAGTAALIQASTTIISTGSNTKANLQLAQNGRIYVGLAYQAFLGVINNPNTLGVGCGYVNNAVNLSGRTCGLGLPNFMPCLLPVILPLEWTYWRAIPEPSGVRLQWRVAHTDPMRGFGIERRASAQATFERIGEIHLHPATHPDLEWLDPAPYSGYNEYRIIAESSQGEAHASETIGVRYAPSGSFSVTLSPNPSVEDESWSLHVDGYSGPLSLQLYDPHLRLIQEWPLEATQGHPIAMQPPHLAQGMYYARVKAPDGRARTLKLIHAGQ